MNTPETVDQPAHAAGWRVVAPFRFREYRLLMAAVTLSIFAEGMWAVVMAFQVIALDDDPRSLSLVATCLGTGLVAFVLRAREPDRCQLGSKATLILPPTPPRRMHL